MNTARTILSLAFALTATASAFDLLLRWNGPGATHPLEGSWPTVASQEYFIETTSDQSAGIAPATLNHRPSLSATRKSV